MNEEKLAVTAEAPEQLGSENEVEFVREQADDELPEDRFESLDKGETEGTGWSDEFRRVLEERRAELREAGDLAAARFDKETAVGKLLLKGYNRSTAAKWYRAVNRDNRVWKYKYPQSVLDQIHARGYLARNIERLGLLDNASCERITDLDYLFLRPMNNNFSKWIEDINTMNRVLPEFRDYLPKIYYSIVNRDGLKILDYPFARQERNINDILETLDKCGDELQLRPAFWASTGKRYNLRYVDRSQVSVNGKLYTVEGFRKLLRDRSSNYLICERVRYDYPITETWEGTGFFKCYIVNNNDGCRIQCAVAELAPAEGKAAKQYLIDRASGTFRMDGSTVAVPHWDEIRTKLTEMAEAMPQLLYYTISVVPTVDGFRVSHCSHRPYLPQIPFDPELNDFLKQWVAEKKKTHVPISKKIQTADDLVFAKFVKKYCRKGIRPYMQRIWIQAVKSDLFYNGTSLKEKVWAWTRGFLSHHIEQYGLTEENYQNFLSDYDYYWLNRINNVYQGWINDKTTFRHVMEPMKEYVPDYYFSVFKRGEELVIVRMQDCPEHITTSESGILQLLREQKKLAFKASAGTHGDGFYCLEYRDGCYWINGDRVGALKIVDLLKSQRTFYLLTSYIEMHPDLKKIYPNSVNSIRIMVINRHGYDPVIEQTYMRIGSSGSGYTDNVGYGGICAMVDYETGRLYDAETLSNHKFMPCPRHPDTGEQVEGVLIPHWVLICEKVAEICQLFPELEYLGFDVAVTEKGFELMEINIHQDLHKVARHPEEVREYFRERIEYKKRITK